MSDGSTFTNGAEPMDQNISFRSHPQLTFADLQINPQQAGGLAGNMMITDMFGWRQDEISILSSSYEAGIEHFTYQTPWMAQLLIARNEENDASTQGLLSGVASQLFETGHLLSTSIYCQETARWVPVQLSWIRGLDMKYYKIHFKTLFLQFLRSPFTPAKQATRLRQVPGFSLAQSEGFINAYMEVFPESEAGAASAPCLTDAPNLYQVDNTTTTNRGTVAQQAVEFSRAQQAEFIIGRCREHFRAQVMRVKQNRSLVPADQETSALHCWNVPLAAPQDTNRISMSSDLSFPIPIAGSIP
ncbi:hypothetical protein MJO28_007821 [Puccinia striiformis f. sp. tritici]|uniref:Uncharacterized protein n=1 Tax=Puccinia striiformis f. sp. tritici TaxID=168172 RepID=A0ACC0EIG7_9BASI|nr:hypothetical protein MJO28_007821 [Puccinia striiformis f. sp. tritici]